MNKWIVCIIALIIGMLMYHMLSNVCGCNRVVEGAPPPDTSNNLAQTPPRSSVSHPLTSVNIRDNTDISVSYEYTGTTNTDLIEDQSKSLLMNSHIYFSEMTLNRHTPLCWAVSINGIITCAISKNDNIGQKYIPSIQQLIDCYQNVSSSELYNKNTHNLPYVIYNTYKNPDKNIFSIEEYPTILNNCLIDLTEYFKNSDGTNTSITSKYLFCNYNTDKDICSPNSECNTYNLSDEYPQPTENPLPYTCTDSIDNRCIQSCKSSNIASSRNPVYIDEIIHVKNDDHHIHDALKNNGILLCKIRSESESSPLHHYKTWMSSAAIFETQDPYEICRINFDGNESLVVDSCVYDFSGNTCDDYINNNVCCNPNDADCQQSMDLAFPINGPYCMIWDEMMGYIRIPGVDSERCKSLSGTDAIYNDRSGWIVDQYSDGYPTENFCKEECDNNTLGCDIYVDHDVLIVGTDYYDSKHYWKVRNNYGNDWGDDGCFYVQRDIDINGNTGRRNLMAINEFVYYVTVKTDPN